MSSYWTVNTSPRPTVNVNSFDLCLVDFRSKCSILLMKHIEEKKNKGGGASLCLFQLLVII